MTTKSYKFFAALLLLFVFSAAASAECKIEDWRSYTQLGNYLIVEGATSCPSGLISIRLYDGKGENKKFLGLAEGIVSGHSFQAIAQNVSKPQELSIKYSIDDSF